MAEVTGLRNNALPYPIYGAPFGITFPLLDADGDPISPSSPDSEISKNGDTFADCTNEATEIATSSGSCYLLLTGTELTCDVATIQAKSTGAKTTVITLYPRKLVTIRSGTSASAGSATDTIVLDASASAIDDFYNGMVCIATIDSNVEVRVISDYVGSTQTATVVPDWNVAPDNNDTFVIKLPDGWQIHQANATHIASTAQTARDIGASVLLSSGTGTGQVLLSSGKVVTPDDQKVDLNTIKTQSVTAGAGVTILASVGTAATSTAQTGDNFARLGAPAGASVSADILAVKTDTAATLVDTNELQTDWTNGGRLDLLIDAILADTNELQVDWVNGGRLDLLVDAIISELAKVPKSDSNVSLNATVLAAIADAMLDRNMATGTDSGSSAVRTPRQALRALRNKWAIAGSTLTVNKEDDSTPSWTSVLTGDAAADPIVESDPAGP